MNDPIRVVEFTDKHLDAAVHLSQEVSWPHRLNDWKFSYSISKGQVAVLDDRVVATALRTNFGKHLSSLNMIIVSSDMRRLGIGRRLMKSLMTLGNEHTYRLVATAEGEPLYRNLGFETVSHIVQCQGIMDQVPVSDGACIASHQDYEQIERLDSETFGGDRKPIVDQLQKIGRLAVIKQNETVVAFAGLRQFGLGHVIGPVIAPDVELAKKLIVHLAQGLEGEFVRIDVTQASGLLDWLERSGVRQVARSPIMQIGKIPISTNRLALFSQALG